METDKPDTESQGTHFWFMSIQVANPQGYTLWDLQGTITPVPGVTRLDLFNGLRADAAEHRPELRSGAVIAFDIQPNQL